MATSNKELRKINCDKITTGITLNFERRLHVAFDLYEIRLKAFDNLLVKNHKKFKLLKSRSAKKKIFESDLEIYMKLEFCLSKLIKGIEAGTSYVNFSLNSELFEEFDDACLEFFKLKKDISIIERVKVITLQKLKNQLKTTRQKIFELENYSFGLYENEEFIGGNFSIRFKNEYIIYKDVSLGYCRAGYSVLFRDLSDRKTALDLLDILAYFQLAPNFLYTKNEYFNGKLERIYNEFSLTDLLDISNKKFFRSSNKLKRKSDVSPIFKLTRGYKFTIINEVPFIETFRLYHSSLKQIEPISRCIFLFRIIEFGKNYHYLKKFPEPNCKIEKIIEYYIKEIDTHKFIPIYYLDYGTIWSENIDDGLIHVHSPRYSNLISDLKRKAKLLINKWKKHDYLKNKSLGEIIYNTGRNTVAHGGNGLNNINYDYSSKYVHINDVNIFLELISRIIIEKLNNGIHNIIEKNKYIYIDNCDFLNSTYNSNKNNEN